MPHFAAQPLPDGRGGGPQSPGEWCYSSMDRGFQTEANCLSKMRNERPALAGFFLPANFALSRRSTSSPFTECSDPERTVPVGATCHCVRADFSLARFGGLLFTYWLRSFRCVSGYLS